MAKRKAKGIVINKAIAQKVLEVVDAGLTHGMGTPEPGKMCVEAAVAYAFGEDHTDHPKCVTDAIARTKIGINDSSVWSQIAPYNSHSTVEDDEKRTKKINKARSRALRRLAIAQLGSKKGITEEQWDTAVRDYMFERTGMKAKYDAGVKVARKDFEDAIKNGTIQYLDFSALPDKDELDPDNVLTDVGADTPAKARKVCEDLVQLLKKLKSPGTKYLYLTE